ncbi:MAG TPA: cytochrome c [Ginsengibacter sp.]|nr:cytochrome c [Ginsengibacter sp.]HRP16549.1 cytochrome c [Ginsengibacter sp.]
MSDYRIKTLVFVGLSLSFLGYTAWIYFHKEREDHPANAAAQHGKMIWQEKNCGSCHQLYGLGGHLGPDLTNVFASKPEAYIRAILSAGTPVMPNFHLSDNEKADLIEFFKYTNSTGTSSPKSFTLHADGTISK